MLSLRDAAFAVDGDGPWSFRDSLAKGFWPPLPKDADGQISARALAARYSEAGVKLRNLVDGNRDKWSNIDRSQLVPQMRDRLRDPGIIQQSPAGLCGPLALVVELIRRLPAEYVRVITDLMEMGRFKTLGGRMIKAEQELREEPVPNGADEAFDIDEADWILAATMRDDDNWWEDVDDDSYFFNGVEWITTWPTMLAWTYNVIKLQPYWHECFHSDELYAVRRAQEAVNAGGVAFLLIDSDLIALDESGANRETEENMWWSRGLHQIGNSVKFGKNIHSLDDNFPPDHWVVFLGDLKFGKDNKTISMRVWSWEAEYILSGKSDSFTEYLYGVVTGTP